jgi:hypothetical protein
MNTHSQDVSTVIDPSGWERALYAFLAEKERRSGSRRTVESYSRMLAAFFGQAGKTPERVTSPEVLSWAHGIGLSGREPRAFTVGARIACLSSFFKFLIRMDMVAANPCDMLERPKIQPHRHLARRRDFAAWARGRGPTYTPPLRAGHSPSAIRAGCHRHTPAACEFEWPKALARRQVHNERQFAAPDETTVFGRNRLGRYR